MALCVSNVMLSVPLAPVQIILSAPVALLVSTLSKVPLSVSLLALTMPLITTLTLRPASNVMPSVPLVLEQEVLSALVAHLGSI